jgi:hypothetical protein
VGHPEVIQMGAERIIEKSACGKPDVPVAGLPISAGTG